MKYIWMFFKKETMNHNYEYFEFFLRIFSYFMIFIVGGMLGKVVISFFKKEN